MSLPIDQLASPISAEGEVASVLEDGSVGFVETETDSSLQIAQVQFDGASGKLIFVRNSGDVIEASGFLSLKSLGQNPVGDKGDKGATGRDGSNGRDGTTGPAGCDGTVGATGEKGPTGNDGEQGPVGVTGIRGPAGIIGERGDDGPTGPTGREGPRGPAGIGCIVGPRGPRGPAPYAYAKVSTAEPTREVFAWLYPTDNPDAALPTTPHLSATLATMTAAGKRVGSTALFSADFYMPVVAAGGTGQYTYKWTGEQIEGVFYGDTDKAALHIVINQQVGAGQLMTFSGLVTCVVHDALQPEKTPVKVTNKFTFVARNYATSSMALGCIVFGTDVKTNKGDIAVEQVVVGDLLYAWSEPTWSHLTLGESEFRNWAARLLKGGAEYSQVVSVKHSTYTEHYRLNDLRITPEQPVLVYRESLWRWIEPRDVLASDSVLSITGKAVPLSVFEHVVGEVQVVEIDVEPIDCFFAGSILVHNADSISTGSK